MGTRVAICVKSILTPETAKPTRPTVMPGPRLGQTDCR